MLDKQKTFGVELAGNQEVCEWAHSPRDNMFMMDKEIESKQKEELECIWTEEMEPVFGNSSSPIRSVEDMKRALADLYWYRVDMGFESPDMCRRRLDIMWIDPMTYSMCSEQTQTLADIYTRDIMNNSCPMDTMNYPPMIKDLLQWFEDSYAP